MMSRSTTFAIQLGIAVFLLVSGALGVVTALSSEPGSSELRAVLAADPEAVDSSGASVASASTTVAETTTTTTAAPGTTNPEQVANRNALVEIPEGVLDTIGGRDSVKVIAFDRDGTSFGDWSGNVITIANGRAEIGKGPYVAPDEVSAPIAVIGRISYSEDAWFEIVIETGQWNTDGFLRWGIYADSDSIESNAWIGKSQVDLEASPIPPIVNDDFWLVLAVDRTTAMLAVVRPGSDTAEGIAWAHDWTVDNWDLGIEVFSGVLSVDKYYILAP